MSYLFWQEFMADYSEQVIGALLRADKSRVSDAERDLISRKTLGRPAASEEQILRRESELGFSLPESLKDFWRASNGMTILGFDAGDNEIFPVERTGYLRDIDPGSLKVMLDDHPDVSDEEYGDREAFPFVRRQDLQGLVALTPYANSAMYLLNPQLHTSGNELEVAAQFFGAEPKRYSSFRELMLDEQKRWLRNLRASLRVA